MAEIVTAPWTEAQVAALNTNQKATWFHPYTCGNNSRHQVLEATVDGWRCRECAYTQNWAHKFSTSVMRKPAWLEKLAAREGK